MDSQDKETIREAMCIVFEKLDYWCDQYKIANDIDHDLNEQRRISDNIVRLQAAYNTLRDLF